MDSMKNWASWRGHLQGIIKRVIGFGMSDEMVQELPMKPSDGTSNRIGAVITAGGK